MLTDFDHHLTRVKQGQNSTFICFEQFLGFFSLAQVVHNVKTRLLWSCIIRGSTLRCYKKSCKFSESPAAHVSTTIGFYQGVIMRAVKWHWPAHWHCHFATCAKDHHFVKETPKEIFNQVIREDPGNKDAFSNGILPNSILSPSNECFGTMTTVKNKS